MQKSTDLRDLPIEQLVPPWILLRQVNKHSVEYLEMRDSLDTKGFLNSISARPCKRSPGIFEIIDGMYRWTCAVELGLETIPTIIKYDVTNEDVLSLQLQANAIRPETSPCDFARQLKRIQKANPGITLSQLAVLISKSPIWVRQQLGLLTLSIAHQKMVDRGEVCLLNAYMLAKIPTHLREEYIDRAKTLPSSQFNPLAANVVKQFKEAVRLGKLEAFFTEEFEPQPHLRSIRMIQREFQSPLAGPMIVTSENCKNPLDGWNAALQWAMHLDRQSVKEQEIAARARVRKKWQS
jgi:ParB/RepB/Spo0J family partition protein